MRVTEWLGNDNKLGIDIFNKKYRNGDETFDQWLDRVSAGNADLRKMIEDKKFLFGGRILANRGLNKLGKKITLSNCYVIEPPKDNIESIFETAGKLARTFSYGGGCGIDISKLAPRGAAINNTAKETTGAVSFMDLYNLVTGLIGQNGRRGALMLSIDCNHPDLEEFIDIKTQTDKITNANISVKVTDEFMKAVSRGQSEYNLTFVRQETGEEIVKTVNPGAIFRRLCENNWNWAEPGILYWDRINNWNLLSEDPNFEYAGVNPCAEEPLPAGGSCLLGALNLAEFVDEDGAFMYLEFRDAVETAVIALNEVLDEGLPLHPLAEQTNSVRDWRQIGLGVMGIADMLIKMGIEYGDDISLYTCDDIARTLAETAISTSSRLAAKYGAYPKFNAEHVGKSGYFQMHTLENIREDILAAGLRNSQLLTIAPTGSISTMLGVSGGIEPIYNTHYTRTTKSLHGHDETYTIYTPIVERFMKENGITDIDSLPNYFVTAMTLNGMKRIKMQSVWQQHIDASISSTVNLPNSATIDDVVKLYTEAWSYGLKGLTIFRDGCERVAILNNVSKDEKKEEKEVAVTVEPEVSFEEFAKTQLNSISPLSRADLGDRLSGSTYVKDIACGKLYITINRDENDNLVEVFIDPGKSGGCSANAECIGRYASACMRGGMKILDIIDVTRGVKCSACTQAKGAKKKIDGLSCGDVIARTIKDEYERYSKDAKPAKAVKKSKPQVEVAVKQQPKTAPCPECGEEMAMGGGCNICLNCGHSKCD